MTFALDLRRFAQKTKEKGDLVVRKVVLDVGTSLVYMSPVGDGLYWVKPPPKGYVGGRFRGNWQYGLNAVNATTTEGVDKEGEATIGRISQAIGVDASGKIHYITNSLPYAQRLEEGWSRQAPFGMVGVTSLKFALFVDYAVKELDRQ